MKKYTLAIGIPAYNESSNISGLLHSIKNQDLKGFVLSDILVVSDNSTDTTNSIVKTFKNEGVRLIVNKKRLGQSKSQNIILRELKKTDATILMNADIQIQNRNTLSEIALNIVNGSDYCIVRTNPTAANTYFESIINFSSDWKQEIFESLDPRCSAYLAGGRIRGLSKRLRSTLRWPNIFTEDVYSKLFAVSKNFQVSYLPYVSVEIKSPDNLKDHLRQSKRFLKGKSELYTEFNKNFVDSSYHIPTHIYIRFFIKFFLKDPLRMMLYVLILIYCNLAFQKVDPIWEVSSSSKRYE